MDMFTDEECSEGYVTDLEDEYYKEGDCDDGIGEEDMDWKRVAIEIQGVHLISDVAETVRGVLWLSFDTDIVVDASEPPLIVAHTATTRAARWNIDGCFVFTPKASPWGGTQDVKFRNLLTPDCVGWYVERWFPEYTTRWARYSIDN